MKLITMHTMHTMNTPIPVKYKHIIADVRHRVLHGAEHAEAVRASLAENWHEFESIEDQELLRSWLLGKFGNLAA